MEGWRPVEDLVRWGFAHAPVVMANEAHNGLARCVRTREVGVRMIRAAHEAGVRRLAMEALHWPAEGTQGPIRAVPSVPGGYLAQPEMRRLIGTALDLGWSLWALAETLAAHGGSTGILRDQAPPPLDGRTGVDALAASTDNALTEDPVDEDPVNEDRA